MLSLFYVKQMQRAECVCVCVPLCTLNLGWMWGCQEGAGTQLGMIQRS